MSIDEIVTLIKARCVRSADTNADAAILLELLSAQRRLEAGPHLPWFLVSPYNEHQADPDAEIVPVPADFLREVDDDALWYYDANAEDSWIPLTKEDYDFIKELYPIGAEVPKMYALVGGNFRVRPVPTLATQYRMMYYRKDVVPAVGVTNLWSTYAPDLLMCEAGQMYAGFNLRDALAEAKFKEGALIARKQLMTETQARADANREYIMGGPG